MHRTHTRNDWRRAPWAAALLGLAASGPAHAWTCDEVMAALAEGMAPEAVIARLDQGSPVDAALVQCLTARGAPAPVIAAGRATLARHQAERQIALAREASARAAEAAPLPEAAAPEAVAPVAPVVVAPAAAPPRVTAARPAVPLPALVVDPGLGETYTDHGVNGFVDAREDRRSTFAVDVDAGSYTMTRRKLTEGFLPPEAAVRVEEFVNYLPYEYARPAGADPFAVDAEIAPDPWRDTAILRIGIQGRRVLDDRRKPVHLTFLVDTSGSMQAPDKLGLVKQSLKLLTERLDDGDTVAIVAYAGSAGQVLGPTPISQRARILSALEGLEAGGSTAMGDGIQLAYALAERTYEEDGVNRVILASDGDANVGPTDHGSLSELIRRYAERGITLTTLGFGEGNYRDTTMEQIADDGDGNYYYIDGAREAERVLVERMTATLEVIAKDVKIQVAFSPDRVRRYRLLGYENRDVADPDFRNDRADGGEIGSGHQVTALYEIEWTGAAGPLGTVSLRNKAPGPDSPAVERSFPLAPKRIGASGSPQLRMALASATFAEILRGSPHVEGVTLDEVGRLARGAARAEYREDAELVALIDAARRLRGEGTVTSR